MTMSSMILLLAAAAAPPAPSTVDYQQARRLAARDEAALAAGAAEVLRESQAALVRAASAACAAPAPQLSPFTVVMSIDASGKVVQTWLQGSSPLAICFRKQAQLASLAPPPAVPFYAYIELSFEP